MRTYWIVVGVLAVGCGSSAPKKESSGSSNNGAANNGVANNGASNNGAENNGIVVVTNNEPSNNSNNGVANNGVVSSCEVLTADGNSNYCNLQATCDDQPLLVECEIDGDSWLCYCGDREAELSGSPCDTPESASEDLAVFCGLGGAGGQTSCVSSTYVGDEYSCTVAMECADGVQYAVGCYEDDGWAYCECFEDEVLTNDFEVEINACSIGNDDLSWWNEGCGWSLSR